MKTSFFLKLVFVLFSLITSVSCAPSEDSSEEGPIALVKGSRLMGLHITNADSGGFTTAFDNARRTGIDFVNLHLIWGRGTTAVGNFLALEADGSGTATSGAFNNAMLSA